MVDGRDGVDGELVRRRHDGMFNCRRVGPIAVARILLAVARGIRASPRPAATVACGGGCRRRVDRRGRRGRRARTVQRTIVLFRHSTVAYGNCKSLYVLLVSCSPSRWARHALLYFEQL